MVLDPVIGILMVASLALLFASAGAHKLRDLKRFEEIFSAYELMPPDNRVRISWLVPILEMAVAVGLILDISRPFAGALGIALLLGYAAAMAVNLRRGRRDLACGCGGPNDRRPIAPWMVWRNVLIALGAMAAFATWSGRRLTLTDGITVAFGVPTIALIYLCIGQLFGNAWRAPQSWGTR